VICANDRPDGPFKAERELGYDVGHTELLGHPQVAHAVAQPLTG